MKPWLMQAVDVEQPQQMTRAEEFWHETLDAARK
jgi:5-bromo-4-chloroindolyl phosphate hydrolysis protein